MSFIQNWFEQFPKVFCQIRKGRLYPKFYRKKNEAEEKVGILLKLPENTFSTVPFTWHFHAIALYSFIKSTYHLETLREASENNFMQLSLSGL